MDQDGNGKVSYEEFCTAFDITQDGDLLQMEDDDM